MSLPRAWYLNADFDLGLRPRPRQGARPGLLRQVRELSLQALIGAAPGDAALVGLDPPAAWLAHLRRCGVDVPRVLRHPNVDVEATLEPFGWSAEAIGLNRRCRRPVPHPPLEVVRRVNGRSFARDLEAVLDPDSPPVAVVGSATELEAVLAGGPPDTGWVVKAEHGNAGLANRRLRGRRLEAADRRFVEQRLAEDDRLVVERWLPRERDWCVVFDVPFEPDRTRVHEAINTGDGALIGIAFEPTAPTDAPVAELRAAAAAVAAALDREGYFGPACVDAFTWRDDGRARLRRLVDLNARHAMSDPAHRLWRRIAPDRVLHYRFFASRKLRLPADVDGLVDALGERAYDAASRAGLLLASPPGLGKLALAAVGHDRAEALDLAAWFRRRFED